MSLRGDDFLIYFISDLLESVTDPEQRLEFPKLREK
jgi:hypothetical protein